MGIISAGGATAYMCLRGYLRGRPLNGPTVALPQPTLSRDEPLLGNDSGLQLLSRFRAPTPRRMALSIASIEPLPPIVLGKIGHP
jgi:hypothetical protein